MEKGYKIILDVIISKRGMKREGKKKKKNFLIVIRRTYACFERLQVSVIHNL